MTQAMSIAYTKPVRKALSRSCIVVTRTSPRSWEVHVRDHQDGQTLIGTIRSVMGRRGKAYSYRLIDDQRVHKGFASLSACTNRILEKI